jgi:hypothetical protein
LDFPVRVANPVRRQRQLRPEPLANPAQEGKPLLKRDTRRDHVVDDVRHVVFTLGADDLLADHADYLLEGFSVKVQLSVEHHVFAQPQPRNLLSDHLHPRKKLELATIKHHSTPLQTRETTHAVELGLGNARKDDARGVVFVEQHRFGVALTHWRVFRGLLRVCRGLLRVLGAGRVYRGLLCVLGAGRVYRGLLR